MKLRNTARYTIPVVVHVVHNGAAIGSGTNLSEERIQSQIDILNEDFSRSNADANQTPINFQDEAADAQIQFCLARVDPEGNPSNGITRHRYNTVGSTGFIEEVIKESTFWDPRRYLNIWTVDMPDASVLGYAFLPTDSQLNTSRDGIVIDYGHFGYISETNRGRTTTHEVGHYLGLQHTWGEVDSDGDPLGCTSDDGIADTPNQGVAYYNCPAGPQSSCSTADMFMNYMDYVNDNCMNLFTQGQRDVMQDILENERSQLARNTAATCMIEECVFSYDLEQSELLIGFEDDEPWQCWLTEDRNADNVSWDVFLDDNDGEKGAKTGSNYLGYQWNQDEVTAADDYIFSPFVDLKVGRVYEVRFEMAAARAGTTVFPERMELGYSFEKNADDFYVINEDWVFDPVDNAFPEYRLVELYLETPAPTTVSFAFHVFSAANQYMLQIDNFSVKDVGPSTSVADQILAHGFKLYPSPFSDIFTVQLDLETPDAGLMIEVKDMLGREVQSRMLPQMQKQKLQFDLSDQPDGIYFVTISSKGRSATKKLMKIGSGR
ncbi:MAG: M43 family zinc metalloprotease [Bacteroidota bacterium]